MKKLFLTSGLILCMACPAFAVSDNVTNASNCDDPTLGVSENNATAAIEAKWTPIAYAINFAAGTAGSHEAGYVTGSTASVSPVNFDMTNIALTSNGFAAKGYEFDHWASDYNLTTGATASTSYADGATLATYAYAGSPTLTAVWSPKTYNVVYAAGDHGTGNSTDANGATFDADYTIKGLGTGEGLSGVTANTGYHFTGWAGTNTDTSYTPATYTETATISPYNMDGVLTLTAQWAANTYDVIYNPGTHAAQGATAYTHTNGATYDANYTALAQNATGIEAAPGYTFEGWNTVNDQTTANWTGETPWQHTDALTVYAAYSANSYKITFTCGDKPATASANISGAAPADVDVVYNETYAALPATAGTCALQGWTFAGWSCANGIVAAGGTYNVAGSTECKATWTANTINLTWNDNGATTPATGGGATCTYDGDITLPTEPAKTGYTFGGWKVSTNEQSGN